MPRGEQVAKPTEREMRLAGRFFGGAIPSALTTSAAPIHHLPEAGTMFKRLLVLGPAALLGAACGIDRPHPTDATVASSATVAFSAVKFWEAGATVSWNKLASDLATAAPTPGIDARRLSAYLSLAQLRAAEAAQAAPGPHPPSAAAIVGASVAVLSSFFPLSSAQLEAALDAQQASDPWPGAQHEDFAAGEAIGRAAGARVLTFAQGDLYGLVDPLLPPVGPPLLGPGRWIYAPPPVIARGGLGARPFFLTSQDQLRSPPPPLFGSPAFNAALAEVRHISDTRTQAQIDIANYWNRNQSPRSDSAFMGIARELIVSHHRRARAGGGPRRGRPGHQVSDASRPPSRSKLTAELTAWRPPERRSGGRLFGATRTRESCENGALEPLQVFDKILLLLVAEAQLEERVVMGHHIEQRREPAVVIEPALLMCPDPCQRRGAVHVRRRAVRLERVDTDLGGRV